MSKKISKEETEKQAKLWAERLAIAVKNQEPMFDKFSKWFDLMHANVNDENIALWRSKVFIPVLAGKAWNLIAKFVGLKPGFEVTLRDPEPMPDIPEDIENDPTLKEEYYKAENERVQELKDRAEKMQRKLEFDYDNPKLTEPIRDKLLSSLIDAVVTGAGFAKVPWCSKTESRYERIVGEDGTVDLTKEKVIESTIGYNDLIPVNIFNFYAAPSSPSLQDAPWIIIKEYKTIKQLKEQGIYKNLDLLENSHSQADQFAQYKKARNRLTGDQDPIMSDKTLDQLAIYECYEGDMIYTYADAGSKNGSDTPWVELRSHKNPYWHGKYPLVRFTVKQRPHDIWGEGLFELTERLQSAINDTFNHYMDNWNLSVDGVWFIDETSNVNDFIIQPGGEITYRGSKPEAAHMPEPNPNSVQIVNQFLEKAIEDATVSSYATGAMNSATDKTQGTATGILRLQQAAGDMISFMKANFMQSIKQVGEMWLSNNQQFVAQPLTLMDSNKPLQVKPADLQGDMELRIDDASMEPMSKEDQKASYLAFVQQALQLQQASIQQAQVAGTKPLTLNFDEMFEDTAEKFGIKSVDSLIVTPEEIEEEQAKTQAAQASMQEQQLQQDVPQEPNPMEMMQ